jgi:hypothetical protein
MTSGTCSEVMGRQWGPEVAGQCGAERSREAVGRGTFPLPTVTHDRTRSGCLKI